MVRTIKSISEEIIKKDRTTVIKNIQRLKKSDLLYNQLELFPGILEGRIGLRNNRLDFLKAFQRKSLLCKAQMELRQKCYEILQEQINFCLFTDKGICTAYTTMKPEKKSTEIYAEITDRLSET